MKIVHLAYVANNEYVDAAKWLKRIDYFTALLTAMAKYGEVINIHFIGHEGVVVKDDVTYHFFKVGFWERWFPFRIHRFVKNLKPDVIMIHGLIFSFQVWQLLWYMDKHTTLVLQHHAEKPVKRLLILFQKRIDPNVQAYFFASKELGNEWVRKKLIRNNDKIVEVMEVPSTFCPIDKNRAKIQSGVTGDPVYLWVGSLDKNKDPLTVAKAFSEFLKIRPTAKLFMIFQSAELLDELRGMLQKAAVSPNSIVLVGRVAHADLIYWYNSADFIISSSHYEGSGVAVCEGMSCGCIPILSSIPSFRWMTKNGSSCGWLYQTGNAVELTDVMKKSLHVNIVNERMKVLDHYRKFLSSDASAKKMMNAIMSREEPG